VLEGLHEAGWKALIDINWCTDRNKVLSVGAWAKISR
jgi:hypothetical protein